jgi:hypothetical protein
VDIFVKDYLQAIVQQCGEVNSICFTRRTKGVIYEENIESFNLFKI